LCDGSDKLRPSPDVLLAGPWHAGEFALLLETLDPQRRWPASATLADAVMKVSQSESPPELVFLAQERPGVDSQTDVERLREVAPLTRIIVVAGTWCEGELRTGRPLTGVLRLYWYELLPWWRSAIERVVSGASPPWSEPLTEVRAGQLVRYDKPAGGSGMAQQSNARAIAVNTKDYCAFEPLANGLRLWGWNCHWQPRHRPGLNEALGSPLAAAIWDGGQLNEDELQGLREFCNRMKRHETPLLLLLDFPRAEHLKTAVAIGAAAILAKPYQLSLLNNELARLVGIGALASRE
jgi:hypothetical protein